MAGNAKKLVVIDGNSLLYRAFFAMRYLSTSDGLPTNAVYGLTTMLLKVLEEKPDYIAVAFDTGKPTFRHIEFDKYKAQRPPTPDALREQAPVARELVRAFNIPVIEVEGYEADDVIGAMVKEATAEGLQSIIVTGDLDALQLVNEQVSVMTTVKGVSDTVIYDPAAVRERFGLEPSQIADYKGLKGDTSDNIPGVPGIGEKTAVNLLKEYGSVENILEHVSDMPQGKVRRTLEENSEMATVSKHLATIVTELPIQINIADYEAKEPDYDALRDLFVRLEFKTMLKRLPEVGRAEGTVGEREKAILGACRRINSSQDLKELIEELNRAGKFAMQAHTHNGKASTAELMGISFSTGPGNTAYVELDGGNSAPSLELGFDEPYKADVSDLAPVLSSQDTKKYCHDMKLAYAALKRKGIELNGVVFDSLLAAYLLDSSRSSYDIGSIAFEQLALELPGVTQKKADVVADATAVVCGEAEAVYRVEPVLEEKLLRDGMESLYNDIEMPLAPVLGDMELAGVAVDFEELGALSTTLAVDIADLEKQIYELAGEEFNIGSTKQLQTILFEKLGLQTGKKTKTGYSTSADALEALASEHPIVELILRYRELTKIRSTYAEALPKLVNPKTGRIHTSLNQAVTATGRLSSSDPNLQNIPVRTELGREIRKAFVASPGNILLSSDYSQIELRILAHVTGDANLTSAFENGEDIHRATACTLFGVSAEDVTPDMRRLAKTVNFAVIYGMTDFTLSRSLGVPVREAREFIETYFAKFPGVRNYIDETMKIAHEQGYVSTPLGRRRYIPEISSANRNIRLFAERAAVNMPIQGMAADIMKIAMIRAADSLKTSHLSAKMLLQVHDELLFEVKPEEIQDLAAMVRWAMEDAYDLNVPLLVEIKAGCSWSEMEPVAR